MSARHSIATARRATIRLCVAVTVLSACAAPLRLGLTETRPQVTTTAGDSTATAEGANSLAKVAVRYFSFSPSVSVVAWDSATAEYGLRSRVRRDGTLIRDHEFYVSTFHFADYRNFVGGAWQAFSHSMNVARPLNFVGFARDERFCDGDQGCSPFETLRVRIPDDFLRASEDSLVVRVFGRGGREETLTLQRDVIDRYLRTVSSVATALRRQY